MKTVLKIAVVALLLRLFLMFVRGDYIVYDEGYYLLLARSLREGHGFSLNGLPHVALSPLQPLVVAGLSMIGIPDLWASRLLACICGAALVFPVASLANRWFGGRGAGIAALFVAVFPALLTFLPFFPGEGWNLYFGSEPLFLLLATSSIAVAARAFDTGKLWLWFLSGALADLSYCTRLEGIVLGFAIGLSVILGFLVQRKPGLLRTLLVYSAGAVVTIPYLVYLHGALGRWAISGRVQAAVVAATPRSAASAPAPAPATAPVPDVRSGSGAVRDFIWGGDVQVLWRTLYALDASGRQMSSQYWGVPREPVQVAPDTTPAAPASVRVLPHPPSTALALVWALLVVVPAWTLLLGAWGAYRVRARLDAALWLLPMVITALVPVLLAYAEPRALLMLVPLVCVLAGGATAWLAGLLEDRTARPRVGGLVTAAVALGLVIPTARFASQAWAQLTPLQQVATASRLVGEYLGAHLSPSDRIVSWHPAVAIWARRDWRVLPYAPLDRIVTYANAQGARVVVLSRFDPSPLRDPPRAFTALLVDSSSVATAGNIHLEQVDATPQLFVGRLGGVP